LNDREKVWTAYHEAGHALVAYLIHPTDDVIKASIVPRKGYLGMVFSRPAEEVYTRNKEYFLADIKISLASYAAERLKFGTTCSGVSGDFNNAYSIAHNMVWRWGMGDSGLLGDHHSMENTSPYGGTSPSALSEKTRETLDSDTQKILGRCLKETEEILIRERDLFEHFAQELLKKEELEYDEIVDIFKKYGKERPQCEVPYAKPQDC
jgi:cell division protease FtsH